MTFENLVSESIYMLISMINSLIGSIEPQKGLSRVDEQLPTLTKELCETNTGSAITLN